MAHCKQEYVAFYVHQHSMGRTELNTFQFIQRVRTQCIVHRYYCEAQAEWKHVPVSQFHHVLLATAEVTCQGRPQAPGENVSMGRFSCSHRNDSQCMALDAPQKAPSSNISYATPDSTGCPLATCMKRCGP